MPLLLAVMMAVSTLPYAGTRGRSRLDRMPPDRLQRRHEGLSHPGPGYAALAFVVTALTLAVARRDGDALVVGVVALTLAAAASVLRPDALRRAEASLRSRDLRPRVVRQHSARRRRRLTWIGVATFAAYLAGQVTVTLDPDVSSPLAVVVVLASLPLSLVGVLALAVVAVWVHGDEQPADTTGSAAPPSRG